MREEREGYLVLGRREGNAGEDEIEAKKEKNDYGEDLVAVDIFRTSVNSFHVSSKMSMKNINKKLFARSSRESYIGTMSLRHKVLNAEAFKNRVKVENK